MSKHLGNIVEPIPLMDTHGADAVRWFMAAGGSPWASRRVGHVTITETVRKVLLTYWNSVAFQALYARTNGWTPSPVGTVETSTHVLDRWLVSVRTRLVAEVTAALENFDTQRYGSLIADFVDDLSNWYVRRSRRRFWDGDPALCSTLHDTLNVVTRLMAPLAPFITERVWQDLFVATDPPARPTRCTWPLARGGRGRRRPGLDDAMQLTRRLVELGRSARAEAKVKTRQPLSGRWCRRVLRPAGRRAARRDRCRAERAAGGVVRLRRRPGGLLRQGQLPALGRGSARTPPRWPPRSPQPMPPRWPRRCAEHGAATVVATGGRGEHRGGAGVGASARRLVGGQRAGRNGGARPSVDAGTGAGRVGPRGRPYRAGAAQGVGAGRLRPDRPGLACRRRLAAAIRAHAATIGAEVLATSITEGEPGPVWVRDDDLGLSFAITRS